MTSYIPSEILKERFDYEDEDMYLEVDQDFDKIIKLINSQIIDETEVLITAYKSMDATCSSFLSYVKSLIGNKLKSMIFDNILMKADYVFDEFDGEFYFHVYPLTKFDDIPIYGYEIGFDHIKKEFVLSRVKMDFDYYWHDYNENLDHLFDLIP